MKNIKKTNTLFFPIEIFIMTELTEALDVLGFDCISSSHKQPHVLDT